MVEWLSPPPFPIKTDHQHKQRYSEILPVNPVKRGVFRFLRKMFGEDGRVADWTRRWLCVWRAEILIGVHKGETFTHALRACCVEWEHNKFAERKRK